jgi:outer membrane protein TolC
LQTEESALIRRWARLRELRSHVQRQLEDSRGRGEIGSSLAAAVEQSRDALNLARDRYSSGVASFIEVLDAQRNLQQNELSLAASTTAVATDLVAVYRTLGGGWDAAT